MKPTANLVIDFFLKAYLRSRFNRPARDRRMVEAQRKNEGHAARILHRGVIQMRSRLQAL